VTDAPFAHEPVLRDATVDWLVTRRDGLYVDATLGRAGHALPLLDRLDSEGRLVGLDRDPGAVEACRTRLAPHGARAIVIHAAFADVRDVLGPRGLLPVTGLLADLGLSSPQLDEPDRGFSWRRPGPLDMRADPSQGETARALLERLDENELADVLYQLGEERMSRRIARAIKRALAARELESTADLRAVVHRAIGSRPRGGIDPATRTFQALRIAVNDELAQLDALLAALPEILEPGGRAAILSYHSLEDRRVKHFIRAEARLEALTKKPVVASEEEVARNPRARSAKLRVCRRREDA
jgi:16S rRNA (cytosine1402-N4)-methyltransferase